jgi:sodium-independent sulfate anion transporter 11
MSLYVGTTIEALRQDHPEWEPHVIASAMALIAGTITAAIGLLRLGWIIDFVSHTAVAAFTTGAAITIALSQVPALLGIRGIHDAAPYMTVIKVFENIKHTRVDAAMGVGSLILLYIMRYLSEYMSKKNPKTRKIWFFVSSLRSVVVILLFTLISFLVNRTRRQNPKFFLTGHVPTGMLFDKQHDLANS